jgi:hypothetical protein
LTGQRLSQALKTTLTTQEIASLRAFAVTLPEASTIGEELAAEAGSSSVNHKEN